MQDSVSHDLPVSEHTHNFVDSVLVAETAQALLNAICSQKAEPADVPLDSLPVRERQQLIRVATMALRMRNPAAVEVATWRAAQAVAVEKYETPFEGLSEPRQRECRLLASTAIIAYTLHLKGFTEAYQERQTVSIVERIKARLAARRYGSPAPFHHNPATVAVADLPHADPARLSLVRPNNVSQA